MRRRVDRARCATTSRLYSGTAATTTARLACTVYADTLYSPQLYTLEHGLSPDGRIEAASGKSDDGSVGERVITTQDLVSG